MKKVFTIIFLVLSMSTFTSSAQVPNSGFETLNSLGNVSNWGKTFLSSGYLDSTGWHPDSIVIDNQLYFPTTDAHSGVYAMEMRNGYNFTSGQNISGGAILSSNDSDYFAFSTPVFIQTQPTDLSFYYKYFPVNNDSAVAFLAVFDSTGFQLGEATIVISGTVSNYTLATTPVVYTMPGTVVFINMSFSTSYSSTGAPQASFGTRFLVDDVSLTGTTGIISLPDPGVIKIYPNPVQRSFSISTNEKIKSVSVKDIGGKESMLHCLNNKDIDCGNLSPGIYFVTVKTEYTIYSEKLLVGK